MNPDFFAGARHHRYIGAVGKDFKHLGIEPAAGIYLETITGF
jgi:hypothetical protein